MIKTQNIEIYKRNSIAIIRRITQNRNKKKPKSKKKNNNKKKENNLKKHRSPAKVEEPVKLNFDCVGSAWLHEAKFCNQVEYPDETRPMKAFSKCPSVQSRGPVQGLLSDTTKGLIGEPPSDYSWTFEPKIWMCPKMYLSFSVFLELPKQQPCKIIVKSSPRPITFQICQLFPI